MLQSDEAVKIALLTMYIIGLLFLLTTFLFLNHLNGKLWTRFSTGIASVILIMTIILVFLINVK
ncbi:hypothetical protein PL11_004605 [Lentilactobacillus curieae]|uniref:Uncharacterized protein n=1 Tax=Lentilactobacillus curieae TaxID=1138822 RepID=A0A1S6QI20_9LACO|nr:hypothetical protein [Lentilactobacillus curieae]AQW21257.1 hypothetical protein PL11_004605 [Lentilactobacillus curieae]